MKTINIPYDWFPRDYQYDLVSNFMHGVETGNCKRFYHVWHRRAGKDLTDLHLTAWASLKRVGTYWHMLPEYKQAKKAIWDGRTGDGKRFIDAFPEQYRKKTNNHEMKIEMENGSLWQLVGSDNIDSLVGTNPVGIVISEYALTNPRTWPLLEPILMENGGWVIFNTTPRGHNHAYDLAEMAQSNPSWYYQRLTVEDTDVISDEQIEELRRQNTPEEIIQQEYFCSFEGALVGAYYAKELQVAEKENRITNCPVSDMHEVHTYWDIGVSDYTSIWFVQFVGREIWLVDFYQENGYGPDHYWKMLKEKGYNYGSHVLPHDADQRQFTLGAKTTVQIMKEMGMKGIKVQGRTPNLMDDINATRLLLNRCVFDREKTREGLDALKSYTKKYDDNKKMFLDKPLHDWSSHAADAFRYMAKGYYKEQGMEPVRADTSPLIGNDLLDSAFAAKNPVYDRI